MQGEVKLSCRNLWKVYGTDPKQFFNTAQSGEDPAALATKMRAEGHMPAAINIAFDVHVGETFVIMGLSG